MAEKTLKETYIADIIELKKSLDFLQSFISERTDDDMFKQNIASTLNSVNTDIKLLTNRIKPKSK